jgi:hypothetical protein
LRPHTSARCPETRFANALTTPKLTMNETTIVVEAIRNYWEPISGTTVRSSPTMPPTRALTSTNSENCPQFSRKPSRMPLAGGRFDLARTFIACGAGLQTRRAAKKAAEACDTAGQNRAAPEPASRPAGGYRRLRTRPTGPLARQAHVVPSRWNRSLPGRERASPQAAGLPPRCSSAPIR